MKKGNIYRVTRDNYAGYFGDVIRLNPLELDLVRLTEDVEDDDVYIEYFNMYISNSDEFIATGKIEREYEIKKAIVPFDQFLVCYEEVENDIEFVKENNKGWRNRL